MYSLRNPFGRILGAAALAIACTVHSGCHFKSNQEYDKLKKNYSIVSEHNLDLQRQNDDMKGSIEVLTDLNKEAVKLVEDRKKDISEQDRLKYERDIEDLQTDKLRLERDKAFLEKHVAGYEKARTNFRTSDGEYLGLKERTARLENQVLDYRLKSEEDKRRISLLERDNPEVQRLKESNSILQNQNSRYRTELNNLRGQLGR